MLNTKSFIMVTGGYALVSFGSVWSQANFFTIIQAKTPTQYKGTITAVSTSLTRIIGPIMSLVSGVLVNCEVHLIFIVAVICLVVSVLLNFVSGLNNLKEL